MATDNKQKVLIRSMSVEEIEKYLVNSDLNGKIIPKNEDTWHQDFSDLTISSSLSCIYIATIVTNISKNNTQCFYINRLLIRKFVKNNFFNKIISSNHDNFYPIYEGYYNSWEYYYFEALPVFRPLIEYKE